MEMDDPILREILRALDRDELPDTASLLADHPDRAETVNRLMRAALDYRRSTSWLSSVRDRPTLAPGCVLGDFEVIDILGRGGASVVYRARQLQLGGRVVALKTALESNLTGGSAERFRRECITLAEIHHPGLAEVYGFGIANGVLYYAMQLIEGPTLREVLGRLRELGRAGGDSDQIDPILRVACDVAQGLSVLHRGGLVHRDVKPSNIIVEADRADRGVIPAGRAVLIDFGLVHPIDPASGTVSCGAGTLVFAAPEQVLGGRVDARADVFALGVTLHDALTGREASARPQASSGLEPLRDVAPFVSKDLAAVVDKAVLIDPEGRYPNAEALLADLEALRRGGAVTARRISPVASAVRVMRSEPRRVLRGALVLLVVGLVLWGVVPG